MSLDELNKARSIENTVREVASILKCKPLEIEQAAQKLVDKIDALTTEASSLREKVAHIEAIEHRLSRMEEGQEKECLRKEYLEVRGIKLF